MFLPSNSRPLLPGPGALSHVYRFARSRGISRYIIDLISPVYSAFSTTPVNTWMPGESVCHCFISSMNNLPQSYNITHSTSGSELSSPRNVSSGPKWIYIQPLSLWWRHQIETFFALLALFAENSPECWCVRCRYAEQTVEQTVALSVIWDTVADGTYTQRIAYSA